MPIEKINLSSSITFDQIYKNCKVFKLEQNYRSTKNILDCASRLPVSRIIVNQPHSKSAGGSENMLQN